MDHPWRSRPPFLPPPAPHGSICPICSISHYPHCLPPPSHHPSSFNQNHGFQFHPHPDLFLQRPPFGPYFDARGPAPVHPLRPLGDLRPWNVNPGLDRSPYGCAYPPCEDNSSAGLKRMRVDESDNERRLKLIRDHGGVSGFERSCGSSGGITHGKFDQTSNNSQADNFCIGNLDTRPTFRHPDAGFGPHHGQENGFGYGRQLVDCNRDIEHKQSQYGHVEGHRVESYHSNSAGQISNLEQRHQSRNVGESLYPYDSISEAENHNSTCSAISYDEKSRFLTENQTMKSHSHYSYTMLHPMGQKHDSQSRSQLNDLRQPFGNAQLNDANPHNNFPGPSDHGLPNSESQSGSLCVTNGSNFGATQTSHVYHVQAPVPASLPYPPMEHPGRPLFDSHTSSSPLKKSSSLFPIAVSSPVATASSYPVVSEAHLASQACRPHNFHLHRSNGFVTESTSQSGSKNLLGKSETFPPRHESFEKAKVIDASHLLKHPHRATRPDHIVILLRGLPGSGKSYLAKVLRDVEVENGGDAPRIYTMDDYFMTEVEKVEDGDVPRSSARGRKPATRKVMEYCYEPEMEEAYRSSMLKAFRKTLDEGVFSFIIVDDRNLRVADFAQFWATAKRSGFEAYILEAPYRDPAGCAARNVHGFTQDDIQQMAEKWEEAPSMYLKLDIKSLIHGDNLEESKIQEVDMDTEHAEPVASPCLSEGTNMEEPTVSYIGEAEPYLVGVSRRDGRRWDPEEDYATEAEVKELGRSKWSNDVDDDDIGGSNDMNGNLGALSGLVQVYSKGQKSIRWGDKVGDTGFLIGAARKSSTLSLIIGPGPGYNLKSNPLQEDDPVLTKNNKSKTQNVFQERLRAECESFKAVFDRKRRRVGLDAEDE